MKKLPTVGTSAATTAFCSVELTIGEGPSPYRLYFDGNGKITRSNGTLDAPKPNAFSLPAQAVEDRHADDNFGAARAQHCPGSTPSCRSTCYVDGLAKNASDTYTLYHQNAIAIRGILDEEPEFVEYATSVFSGWININALGGFRWHVSGDVFSAAYARFIADVCRKSPTVEHWIYTRSFAEEILEPLAEVSTLRGGNLALNLSCDKDNIIEAIEASIAHGWGSFDNTGKAAVSHWIEPLRLCYLTIDGTYPDDLPNDSVIFPNYNLRSGTEAGREWFAALPPDDKSKVCPVDYVGKSEQRRCGPCDRCLT